MNRRKGGTQMILGAIIPVAVSLVVVASTLAQGPPRTELLNSPQTVFLPFVAGSGPSGTSFELIEQALARGEIDEETALVYKVFAVHLDPRLPERFVGDDSQVRDTQITAEVAARWLSLSPATQALLEPFFLPPAAPGSWLELQQAQAATAGPAEAIEWVALTRPENARVKVWYQTRYPGDDARAAQILADVEKFVWPHLTELMRREPLPDTGLDNNGGDALLDIYLVRLRGAEGQARGYKRPCEDTDPPPCKEKPGCKNRPAFLLIDGATANLRAAVVHEFMHAIIWGYNVAEGCEFPEYRWLNEATATWAMDYISPWYDTGNEEHIYAKKLLLWPKDPLETRNEAHEYGAYLWPFYLARSYSPELVRTIWEATESEEGKEGRNSLAAIDFAISGSGGFLKQWPKFTELNLNQEPVDRYNKEWDSLKIGALLEDDYILELGDEHEMGQPLNAVVPHLAAIYYGFTFDDAKISQVRYENAGRFFAGVEPRAHVGALFKIEGQGWTSEDWTRLPERKFCRTEPDERIQELVIIFSNSEWENREHHLEPGHPIPTVWYNDKPCSCEELSKVKKWTGQVAFSFTASASSGGKSISYDHSATVNLQMVPDYETSDFVSWQDASLSGTGEVNDTYITETQSDTLVGRGALYPGGPTQDDPSASFGVWRSDCTFEFYLQTGMPATHTIRAPYYEETFSVSTGVGHMDINDIPASQLTGSRTVPAVWYPISEPSWFVPGSVLDSDFERLVGNYFGEATVSWSFGPAD